MKIRFVKIDEHLRPHGRVQVAAGPGRGEPGAGRPQATPGADG